MNIKNVKTIEELKRLFCFLSKTFYEDSIEHNEHYYIMGDRYEEMKELFNEDKELLLYIEIDNKIVAGLTGKSLDKENSKVTIGVLATKKEYRNMGFAKALVNEFEKRCINKNIKHISLGARFRACPLYLNLDYKYSLMVQVYDFMCIDDIRKSNKYIFKELSSYQSATYGFIIYDVDKVTKEYIDYFENNVSASNAQYIFEKEL